MTAFHITCTVCGGAITPHGWTSEGNQRGHCTDCHESVTVTVHADYYGAGRIDRDAPFYPLVELVDGHAAGHKKV